ncbi:MAG: ATP-binding protein [Gemmatales bacterium]
MPDRLPNENRVLLLAPTAKDASASADLLQKSGLRCHVCRNLVEICGEFQKGAGLIILPEEAILFGRGKELTTCLNTQPSWSNIPVVVLTAAGSDSAIKVRAILELGDVTLLKRPLEVVTLVNAVKAALRDRERQYLMRDYLIERKSMEDALLEADRKKDDFIALLAHELRNPLAPIRNGLQVMRLAGGDVNAVANARAMMDRQLSHMVRLVDDLLDVSRIRRNKMELRKEQVLLSDALNVAVETSKPIIEAAGHDLQVVLPPGPVFLNADLTRLAQVFSNLLTNSAKYTKPGGRIRLFAERRTGEVTVSVQDNGIGIPSEAISHIFDMFSQVDRTIERSTGGLGIGLALVKGLVEMHGGTVTAESDSKGSIFTVRLPLKELNPKSNSHTSSDKGHGSRRVLVVDDNRDGADSLAMMLNLLGDEIRTAHDGIEAIEVAERFRPEVILMDVGMPRLNGLEATRRIREKEWGKAITIIALTGWGQDSDREKSKEAGCNGHLVKPVHLPDLQKAFGAWHEP